MSFHNGYQANAYIENCILRYKKDPLIFYKCIQVISTFSMQSSWPHNYDQLKNVSKLILGDDIEVVLRFAGEYLYSLRTKNVGVRQVEWPEDLPTNFIEDLQAFYYSVDSIIERARFSRVNPMRYYGVARSQTPSSDTKMLKFMRMDGNSIEIEMSKSDVERMIRTLEIMIQDSCELK